VVGRPFRDAPIRETCTDCESVADLRCERCGSPLCPEHAPARSSRCTDCESLFHARVSRPVICLMPLGLWLLGMFTLGVLGATVYYRHGIPFSAGLALMLSTVFLSPFVVGAARSVYILITRWRFLRERDDRSRLPVQYSADSWFDVGESW